MSSSPPTPSQPTKAERWSHEYRHLLEARIIARSGEQEPSYAAVLKEIASRDPHFFINTFGVIVNRRKAATGAQTTLPFLLFPFQRDLVDFLVAALRDGKSVLIPKSREMGVTWLCLVLIIWAWLFIPGFSVLLGSRREDEVDVNPGSRIDTKLFGRLEILLDHLPPYLLPAGFDLSDRAQRQKMLLLNPENGNMIAGEPPTANFSRQGRYTLILMDELDFWPDSDSAFSATADAAHARWMVTTPNPYGQGTVKRIIDDGLAEIYRVPWELHPERDLNWRMAQDKGRFKERAAQELDISWAAHSELRIYPEWDTVPKGSYPYMPGWPTFGAIDFGRSDGTGIVYLQRHPGTGRHRILASYYRAGEPLDFYFPFLGKPIASGHHQYGPDERALIEQVQRWAARGITWYGDPAGSQLTQNADRSIIQQLADQGVYVITNPAIIRHEERQTRTRLGLRDCEVNIGGCRALDLSMQDYRVPRPTANTRVPSRRPVHNWASHLATALEYYFVNAPAALGGVSLPAPSRHVAAWEAV